MGNQLDGGKLSGQSMREQMDTPARLAGLGFADTQGDPLPQRIDGLDPQEVPEGLDGANQ